MFGPEPDSAAFVESPGLGELYYLGLFVINIFGNVCVLFLIVAERDRTRFPFH